jgi:hypothetical protein
MRVFVNISLVFLGFYTVFCDVTWSSGTCLVRVCWLSWARCDLCPSWVGCLAFRVGNLRPVPELGQVPCVCFWCFATCSRVGSGALHSRPVLCDLRPSWAKCLASASGACDLCPSWAKCLAPGHKALRFAPELGQVPCVLIEEHMFPLGDLPCDMCRSSALCLAAQLLFGFAWESRIAT